MMCSFASSDYLNNRSITSTESLFEQELSAIDNKLKELYALRENVQNRLQTLKDVRRHPLGIIEQTYHHTRHCHMIQSGYQTDEEMDVLIKQLLNKDEHNLYIIGNNRIGSLLALNDVRKQHFHDSQSCKTFTCNKWIAKSVIFESTFYISTV